MIKSRQKLLVKLFLLFSILFFSANSNAIPVNVNTLFSNYVTQDAAYLTQATTITNTDAINQVNGLLGLSGASAIDVNTINSAERISWGNPVTGSTQSSLTVITNKFNFTSASYTANGFDDYLALTEQDMLPLDPFTGLTIDLAASNSFSDTTGFQSGSYVPLARFIFTNGSVFTGTFLESFDLTLSLDNPGGLAHELSTTVNITNSINDPTIVGCCPDGLAATLTPTDFILAEDPAATTSLASFDVEEGATASSILWARVGSLYGLGFFNPTDGATTTLTTDDTVYTYTSNGVTITTVPSPTPLALMFMGIFALLIGKRERT